ncbi:MAG: Nif3-like dinuclear metal center hexameric protein [Thermoproteota archaeon]|nr:Nif3-like dinuclear metal center hexameric protein [Thermoproteota archaeon]
MVSTREIMSLALSLADFEEAPPDTAIYVEGENIKKVLVGIDVEAAELMLAKQLGYDAVISHHPKGGKAVINFHEVFDRHVEQMVEAGVPVEAAKKVVEKKRRALEVEMHTRNYDYAVSVAKLLNMPYMNIHTPLDEIGRRRMKTQIEHKVGAKENATVDDVVSALKELPEFSKAVTDIKIRLGKGSNKAGKVVVSHGAGTNGGYEVAKTYFKYGIGTIVYIHVSVSDLEKLRADGVGNLLVTGHIASDSLGINPFISELERRGISVTRIGIVPP